MKPKRTKKDKKKKKEKSIATSKDHAMEHLKNLEKIKKAFGMASLRTTLHLLEEKYGTAEEIRKAKRGK